MEILTAIKKPVEENRDEAPDVILEAINAISDGFAVYDSRGYLLLYNEQFRAIHDYREEDVVPGVTTYDQLGRLDQLISGNTRTLLSFGERLQQIQRDGPFKVIQYQKDRIYERRQSVTPSGGLVSVLTDITNFKRTEEKLVQSLSVLKEANEANTIVEAERTKIEARYQSLFNNMLDEVHFWKLVRDDAGNIKNWQLVDINPVAVRSWGMPREETIGKTADQIFSPAAVELFMPIVTKIFKDQKPYSWDTYFPDLGQHLQMTSVPFGEYFISTGMDITRIKKAQLEAERANQVKSEFLASMSHELRTPLNAILGYSQMLQLGVYGELEPKQKEMTANIVDGGKHLLRLVDDVLDLAHIESNQLHLNVETFEANEVVRECVKWITGKCKNRQIHLNDNVCDGQKYLVKSDKVRLAQVVTNLLSNAEKYNVDGGTITIRGEVTANGYLRISVLDTGKGIKPAAGPRIFDLFDRGIDKPEVAGGGLGVGLAVSRNIIERLGGWIDYRSTVGAGSDFWITVPLADNEEVLIWTDDLRVGIDEIDKDHQQIFTLTNRASRMSLDVNQVSKIIQQMIAYTHYHFKREEVIMEVVDYPDFVSHCAGHRKLEAQVQSYARVWQENPTAKTRQELQHFLRDWWRKHIMVRDLSIARLAVGKEKRIRDELNYRGLMRSPLISNQ